MSQVETKPEPVINLEEPDIKLAEIQIKPIEVDIAEEDQEKTVEESSEKDEESDDEKSVNDDYETMRSKEKKRWKRLLNSTPMETYEQIIEWLELHKAKRWFMDRMIFKRKDDTRGSREQVAHNLLELSRLLKIADKHLDECTDPSVKERFLNGAYLRAVKRRNQVMNLWKLKDEEGCVQFLRENPIIGKYGKRVQEVKPKKN